MKGSKCTKGDKTKLKTHSSGTKALLHKKKTQNDQGVREREKKKGFDKNAMHVSLEVINGCGDVEKKSKKNRITFLQLLPSFFSIFQRNSTFFIKFIKRILSSEKNQ
jgi:hypothetical protein